MMINSKYDDVHGWLDYKCEFEIYRRLCDLDPGDVGLAGGLRVNMLFYFKLRVIIKYIDFSYPFNLYALASTEPPSLHKPPKFGYPGPWGTGSIFQGHKAKGRSPSYERLMPTRCASECCVCDSLPEAF